MDYGALSSYFDGAVAKTLADVDIDASKSNQHEFNGTRPLRSLFGDDDIRDICTTFVYMCDDAEPEMCDGTVTWYDARRSHPTRTEYRLYYKDNAAIRLASAGDLMVLANSDDLGLLILFAKRGSNIESQLRWLFGFGEPDRSGYAVSKGERNRIGAVASRILAMIGIETRVPLSADAYLEDMVERFGGAFPRGIDFTEYSVSTLDDLDWRGNPDRSLLACYEREEMLFKVFERHLLERDLAPYLNGVLDVDGILKTTMSTFQRRKSRAGTAFEHQLEFLFKGRGIRYSSQPYTESKSKPDFIFPSIECYRDDAFPPDCLTMLGAKTTIKERWRQVLEEANRIAHKHLITLEPAVSVDYTNAMRASSLQLVVPHELFATYTTSQQDWLMDVASFCSMVEERQSELD